MKVLSRYFSFRPYGDRLLTSSAAFWLFAVRSLVFALGSVEALSWGYWGLGLVHGEVRWLIAAFIGGSMFFLVWMINVSLVTMDRAWVEHTKTMWGQGPPHIRRQVRNASILATHVAMLLGSFTIAVPYFTRLLLHGNLEQPEYQQTQLAVASFLFFTFAGLLLLKLFEPNPVRLYFSSFLQQAYTRYLAGAFDAILPPTERALANRGVMSPQRLYGFLVNVWAPAQAYISREGFAMENPFLTKAEYTPGEDQFSSPQAGPEISASTGSQLLQHEIQSRFGASQPISTALTLVATIFVLGYGSLIGVLTYRAVFESSDRVDPPDWFTVTTVHLLLVAGIMLLVIARYLRQMRSQEFERILMVGLLSRAVDSISHDPVAHERLLGNLTNRLFSGQMRWGHDARAVQFDAASSWILQRLEAGNVIYAVPDGFEDLENRIENFLEERGATLHILRAQVPTEVPK